MPKTKQFDEVGVLQKAKEVFHLKGYNGTSMDDLVQATGLSRSSMYDTFGDKHALFLKVLDYYRNDERASLQSLLDKTSSPKKKIAIVFDNAIREIMTDKEGKGCLLINVSMELNCVDKSVLGIALESMEDMETSFAKWVKEGQALGEIPKRFPPKSLARYLYSSFSGLRTTARTRPDAAALRDTVKLILSILQV
jgi:TetR/AcrR family transcriptional regulator, transcriptional repressor for nem operon